MVSEKAMEYVGSMGEINGGQGMTDELMGQEESPTLEKSEESQQEEPRTINVDEIRGLLEAYDIKDATDLSRLVENPQTGQPYRTLYGQDQNVKGELRRELENVRTELDRMKRQQHREYDPYDNQTDQTVDLAGLIDKRLETGLKKFWTDLEQERMAAEEQYWGQMNQIRQRPNFKNIEPMFNEALNDPAVRRAVNSNQITLDSLYSRLSEKFLVSKLNALVNQIPEGVDLKERTTPDTSERVPVDMTADQVRQKKIEDAKESGDMIAMLEGIVPDDSPLLQGLD